MGRPRIRGFRTVLNDLFGIYREAKGLRGAKTTPMKGRRLHERSLTTAQLRLYPAAVIPTLLLYAQAIARLTLLALSRNDIWSEEYCRCCIDHKRVDSNRISREILREP